MAIFKKVIKVVLIILGILIVAFGAFLGWLTAKEYKPAEVEKVTIDTSETTGKKMVLGTDIKVMSWNVGYGALGDNADFFMDGGTSTMTATPERLDVNLAGIRGGILTENPDILFIQELDLDSKRSHNKDENEAIKGNLTALGMEPYVGSFAYNFNVEYLPYPIPDTMGKVKSGIETLSRYEVTDAERRSLPCPFSWPVRTINLKRCILINRIPVYDENEKATGKELVMINLHLEAYDDGEGKTQQTQMLKKIMQDEYDKGNYVIAGGDFNQTFSGVDDSKYPKYEGMWECGEIDQSEFGSNWQFFMDTEVPTCRSLDKAYQGADKDNFQYYMIDGFIVSDNIEVSEMHTKNMFFAPSDHNPVTMNVKLK